MDERDFVERMTYFAKDEAVEELLRRMEAGYVTAWKTTQPADMATRDTLYSLCRVISDFRSDMQTVAGGLKVEAYNRRLADRFKAR